MLIKSALRPTMIRHSILSLGTAPPLQTFKLLMAELDRDGTGQISLKEWSTGLQKRTHR